MIKNLCDIASIDISGVDKKSASSEIPVKLLNFTDVYYNWQIDEADSNFFMNATAKDAEITKFLVRKGNLAITKDSETRDDIGIPCLIDGDLDNVILGYHCALIRPNEQLVDSGYLAAYLNSVMARTYFSNQASGSGQRYTLSVNGIGSVKVLLPEIDEQKKISSLIGAINKKIKLNNRINDNLQQLLSLIINRHLYNAKDKKRIILKKLVKRINIPVDSYVQNTPTIDLSVMPSGSFSLSQLNNSASFETNLTEMKEGNILFGSIRPYLQKAGIAPCNGAVTGTIYQYEILDDRFYNLILYALTSQQIFEYATKSCHGTKMPVVNSDRLLEYPIEYTEELLNDISALNFKDIIIKNCKEISYLINLRDFLLPLLMNGQATID